MDLEGIVSKYAAGKYTEKPSWFKIKNPNYSQAVGREELFEELRSRTVNACVRFSTLYVPA